MAQADIAQIGRVHRPAMRHGSLSVTELYSWPSVQSKGLIFLSAATQSSQFLFVRSKAANVDLDFRASRAFLRLEL